jgi:uncharacterized protein (TIGR00369 family)
VNATPWFLDGEMEPPPSARLLGFEIQEYDADAHSIRVRFTASADLGNLAGNVQGGFLCAMLDSAMGSALVATVGPGHLAPTIDLQVQFHAPAHLGELIGVGRVVRLGRSVSFLAGELTQDGHTVATATATATVRDLRTD